MEQVVNVEKIIPEINKNYFSKALKKYYPEIYEMFLNSNSYNYQDVRKLLHQQFQQNCIAASEDVVSENVGGDSHFIMSHLGVYLKQAVFLEKNFFVALWRDPTCCGINHIGAFNYKSTTPTVTKEKFLSYVESLEKFIILVILIDHTDYCSKFILPTNPISKGIYTRNLDNTKLFRAVVAFSENFAEFKAENIKLVTGLNPFDSNHYHGSQKAAYLAMANLGLFTLTNKFKNVNSCNYCYELSYLMNFANLNEELLNISKNE